MGHNRSHFETVPRAERGVSNSGAPRWGQLTVAEFAAARAEGPRAEIVIWQDGQSRFHARLDRSVHCSKGKPCEVQHGDAKDERAGVL